MREEETPKGEEKVEQVGWSFSRTKATTNHSSAFASLILATKNKNNNVPLNASNQFSLLRLELAADARKLPKELIRVIVWEMLI